MDIDPTIIWIGSYVVTFFAGYGLRAYISHRRHKRIAG
jgi:hypothetical protein